MKTIKLLGIAPLLAMTTLVTQVRSQEPTEVSYEVVDVNEHTMIRTPNKELAIKVLDGTYEGGSIPGRRPYALREVRVDPKTSLLISAGPFIQISKLGQEDDSLKALMADGLGLSKEATWDEIFSVQDAKFRAMQAKEAGLPETASFEEVSKVTDDRVRAIEASWYGLPPTATWNDIMEKGGTDQSLRKSRARAYGLPEDATWDTIFQADNESLRKQRATAYNLPENAPWEQIFQMDEDHLRRSRAKAHGLIETASWEEIFKADNLSQKYNGHAMEESQRNSSVSWPLLWDTPVASARKNALIVIVDDEKPK